MLFAAMPERTSFGFRLFCGLLVVALIALSIGGVAGFLSHGAGTAASAWTSLATAALVVSLGTMAAAFALPVGAWVLTRARRRPLSLRDLAFWLGLAVGAASASAAVAAIPASGSSVVPDFVRVGVFLGLGLIGLSLAWTVIENAMGAVRKGDWFRVAAMVICVALLGVFVWVRLTP